MSKPRRWPGVDRSVILAAEYEPVVARWGPCTKLAFATEAEAWRWLFERALGGRGRRPIRPYACAKCHAWHTSSRPLVAFTETGGGEPEQQSAARMDRAAAASS